MTTATIHDLRHEAKRLDCTLEVDNDCQCYRAVAPEGQRFETDLHELIAVFGGGVIGNDGTKVEARADLLERLKGYVALESCECCRA